MVKFKYAVRVFCVSGICAIAAGCSAGAGPDGPGGPSEENTGTVKNELSAGDQVTLVAVNMLTGGDDKRSDSEVTFRLNINGQVSQYTTDGQGVEWNNNTWSGWFYARLPVNTNFGAIRDIGVELWEHDGFIQTDDNWNLNELDIWAQQPNGAWTFVASPGGNPLVRLTGSQGTWHWGQF